MEGPTTVDEYPPKTRSEPGIKYFLTDVDRRENRPLTEL